MNRETITVYAVDKNGGRVRVAGYDRKTALQVVNDETILNIVHAVKLIAIDRDGNIIASTNDPDKFPESPENPPPLRVCPRCLMAIESREGRQFTRPVYFDDDEPARCEWCEEEGFTELYEFL